MRIPYISLLAAGALALGGCAYGDLGLGMGYGDPYYGGYGGYGYGPYGGYGTYPGYYGGFGYGLGYGGYGYGNPYYGWYDNYYYPGTGYYVYDTYRQPHVMTTTQRQYWSRRSPALRTSTTTTRVQPNWTAFDRRTATTTAREDRQTAREQRRADRQQRRRDGNPY
jgi:hypothetical protein